MAIYALRTAVATDGSTILGAYGRRMSFSIYNRDTAISVYLINAAADAISIGYEVGPGERLSGTLEAADQLRLKAASGTPRVDSVFADAVA